MIKVAVVFGTRPDAIKMCPLVLELQKTKGIEIVVIVTGQHREMLKQVLDIFGVEPDYDLGVMRPKQTLSGLTSAIIDLMTPLLEKERPDICLVHGDTTTAFATALCCFYIGVPVGHVEAGLRTYNVYSPFPEEFNRQTVTKVAKLHFTPTQNATKNLVREAIPREDIYTTGNTVIDALRTTIHMDFKSPLLDWAAGRRILLVTAHRRENIGDPLHSMLSAIRAVVEQNPDTCAIYPVHLNPLVRQAAREELSGCESIRIIEPLDLVTFHNLLSSAYIVLTDSGGIQEEAAALGKPVLVMRDTTERPEGLAAGTLELVGTKSEYIVRAANHLLKSKAAYALMSEAVSPYGDGHACERIVAALLKRLPFAEERS